MKHLALRLTIATLVLIAAAAMVLQGGSLPHLHQADSAGLYNQEHDLSLLAGLAGHGVTIDATPALAMEPVSAAVVPLVAQRPAARLARSGDSRAPPAA